MKSNNILNNLIYKVFTKTIKKTNLPIVLNKTKLKQIDSHNISYTNQEEGITALLRNSFR